jgi:hypothetical protein
MLGKKRKKLGWRKPANKFKTTPIHVPSSDMTVELRVDD